MVNHNAAGHMEELIQLAIRTGRADRAQGRPAQCDPTAEDLQKLRAVYVRTNLQRDKGSKVFAARLLARSGELSDPVADAILKERATKALPKCVRDQMHVPIDIIRHHRSPRDANLTGFYIPGSLRMVNDADGLRRLFPGERQSWDDATINFGICVPWEWRGCPCSDRYGVKLGRFQLLACIDDCTDNCPGYSYTIRDLQSYRAEDTVAAQFRLGRDTYAPDRYMLEGGVWQSNRANAFYKASGIEVEDATGRPHSKLIECWFNRLWTPLSLLPGNVGRFRGEMELGNKLYLKCRAGREDPRNHFPMLDQALKDMDYAIGYLNAEQVESKKYGNWVPQKMHGDYLASNPRRRLDPALAYMAAPIMESRMIRRNMVQVSCPSPFGGSLPYHFADDSMWQFEGARALVYFDPYDSPLRAAVVLEKEFHGFKAGHVISACALCLDDAPEVLCALDGLNVECNADATERAIAMRKRIHGAIRREYRAIGFGGKITASASEVRGEGRKTVVEISTGACPDAGETTLRGAEGPGDRKAQEGYSSPLPPHPRRTSFADPQPADRRDVRRRLRGEIDLAEMEAFERQNYVPAL